MSLLVLTTFVFPIELASAHTASSTGHYRYNVGVSGSTWRVRGYTTNGSSNSGSIDYGYASLIVGSTVRESLCANTSTNCGDRWTSNHYYNAAYGLDDVISQHCARYTDGHELPLNDPNFGHWCTYWPNYLNFHWHVFDLW
mgnify:FL=1|jgi:hypothetical protein